MIGDVALDGGFQVGNGFEDAPPDTSSRDDGEKAFDRIKPGRRGGREVEDPSRVISQPLLHLGMLVGSVVIQDDVDDLTGRGLPLQGIEELDEFLMAMAFHAAAEHRAVQDIEGSTEAGKLHSTAPRPALAALPLASPDYTVCQVKSW